MVVRSVVVGLSFAGMLYAGATAWAAPKAVALSQCCSESGDCDGGSCCDPDVVGLEACSQDRGGYCMTACKRPDGNGLN